jgi:hypothetical protein
MQFLETGKSIYFEGNDFFKDHDHTDLYALLGCRFVGDGNQSYDISRVRGRPETFVEDLTFLYHSSIGSSYKPDEIAANGGVLLLACQKDRGRVISDNGLKNYRLIASGFVFGSLLDDGTVNTKNELMRRYMDYLLHQIDHKEPPIPIQFVLNQNIPNPFNTNTVISYTVNDESYVRLEIYNSLGQLVRLLVAEKQEQGMHSIPWDGKSSDGIPVSSGVYYYTILARDHKETKRMILLR